MTVLAKQPLNIIICGVGGQGNILASELLASALVAKGFLVTVGETYGASQRGGAVMSHVRLSADFQYGPLIPRHTAHIIVGFEPVEALRVVRDYGNRETTVIFDPRPNYPLGVLTGEALYPELNKIETEIRQRSRQVFVIEATERAKEAGDAKAANILLMGAVTALAEMPLGPEDYEQVLAQRFSGPALTLNRQVFNLGYRLISGR